MVTALEALGQLDGKIQTLGRHLVTIFNMALTWQKVVVTETPLPQGQQVMLKAEGSRTQPSCVDVFSVVGNILEMLNDSLLHVVVERKADGGKATLMNLLGEEIGEKVKHFPNIRETRCEYDPVKRTL